MRFCFVSMCKQFRQQILVSLFYFSGSFRITWLFYLPCFFHSIAVFIFLCFHIFFCMFFSSSISMHVNLAITWHWRWPIEPFLTWMHCTPSKSTHIENNCWSFLEACRNGLTKHARPLHVYRICVKYSFQQTAVQSKRLRA